MTRLLLTYSDLLERVMTTGRLRRMVRTRSPMSGPVGRPVRSLGCKVCSSREEALRCGPGRVDWHCVVVDLGFPRMTSGRVVCLQGKVLKQPKESVNRAESLVLVACSASDLRFGFNVKKTADMFRSN